MKLLRDGLYLKPDIVISYSGINDAWEGLYYEGHPLVHRSLKNRTEELPLKNKVGYGFKKTGDVVSNWITNIRTMDAVCKEFGIKFYSFLQPTALGGGYTLTKTEEELIHRMNTEEEVNGCVNFFEKVRPLLKDYPYIHDFTDIFKGMSGIFYDVCHCNEKGNQIIAENIGRILLTE